MSRPIRFTFIVGLAALATALAAVSGWRFARASAPLSGPIVLISIDTLRADRLPAYGYAGVRTPAIDALAADGVVFERAYAHAPQTLPAHAAILTGRLPFETGVRDNVGFALKPAERSLAQMLRDRGYATGGVVSAFALRKATGIAQGFDFFDGEMAAGAGAETVGQLKRDGGASEAIAEKWLTSIGSSRALLFLHIDEPHRPYVLPERFNGRSPYDDAVAYGDEIVGRLVHYLKSHQLYDRSTIVLLSDHGEGLGDHGEQGHGLFLYEEDLHVPLIIKQEGNAGAGRRVADVVQQIDLVPTILDLVKAPAPGNLRGRSLKPLLDGATGLPAAPVYSEAMYGRYHFGWSETVAVTDGRYRFVNAPVVELYDLKLDPHERENVGADRPKAIETMRAALARFGGEARLPMPEAVPPSAVERLQALGYLGGVAASAAPAPGGLPDPKAMGPILDEYRHAIDLAGDRRWREAIASLQQLLREQPGLPELWRQLADFAERIDRFDLAADAFRHYADLEPATPTGYLGAAAALLKQRKFEEARVQALRAADVAAEGDRGSRAAAHALVARIALARHDGDGAREAASRAHDADARIPLDTFVDARLAYDQGSFDAALPLFEQALDEQRRAGGTPLADLHYYAGETYSHLERYSEAETQFAAELADFPYNIRARAGLAAAYHALGQPDAAARTIGDMTDLVPTTESYTLAARLWTLVGNKLQADAVRAELRERSADASRAQMR